MQFDAGQTIIHPHHGPVRVEGTTQRPLRRPPVGWVLGKLDDAPKRHAPSEPAGCRSAGRVPLGGALAISTQGLRFRSLADQVVSVLL